MIRTILISILALLSLTIQTARAESVGPYSYIVILADGEQMQIDDSLFYAISRKVIFPVNKSTLPENSDFRREYVDKVLPMLRDENLELVGVKMRGAASPEGPVAYNQQLSQRRLQALMDVVTLADSLKKPSDYQTEAMGEDYIALLLLMKKAGDADYTRVARIVDQNQAKGNAAIKSQLMRINGGKLFWRLHRTYFADLRAARVVLFFRRREPVKPVPEPEPPLPPLPEPPVEEPVIVPEPVDTVVPVVEEEVYIDTLLPRRELLSVKTNMLFNFMWMPGYDRWCPIPNVALEYYPKRGHITYAASFDFPWWQHYWDHKYFQVRNYTAEARYYLKASPDYPDEISVGPAFKGWYGSVYAHAALYCLCFDENRGWIGEGAGAGVGVGYVMPLSKKGHWRLELEAKFGVFYTKYDPFQYECPVDPTEQDHLYYYKWTRDASLFKKRQYRYTWLGPTRIGVTLSYDLLYRRRNKRGASFRSTERALVKQQGRESGK